MDGDIRLVAHHPTIVPGLDVKKITWLQHNLFTVAHAYRTTPFERQADVFHLAQFCSGDRTHVLAPLPPRLIAGAAHGHAADGHQLQLAFFKLSFFIRLLKLLQKDLVHRFLRDTHLQKLESVIPSGARRGGRSRGTMRLLFPKLYKTAEINPPPPSHTFAANVCANAP